MARITEKSALVAPVGIVCSLVVAYFVWSHRRTDAIETTSAVEAVELRANESALTEIKSQLETISRDTTDLRGDMREVRAILEHRLSGTPGHAGGMP